MVGDLAENLFTGEFATCEGVGEDVGRHDGEILRSRYGLEGMGSDRGVACNHAWWAYIVSILGWDSEHTGHIRLRLQGVAARKEMEWDQAHSAYRQTSNGHIVRIMNLGLKSFSCLWRAQSPQLFSPSFLRGLYLSRGNSIAS